MFKSLISVFSKEQQSIKMARASKTKKALIYLLSIVAVFAIYMLVLSPMFSYKADIEKMIPMDIGTLTLTFGFYVAFLFAFISSFGYVLSSGYLDKNLSNYLVLPIKKSTFILAKLTTVFYNVIMMVYFILLPFIITYFIMGKVTIMGVVSIIVYPVLVSIFMIYLCIIVLGTVLYFVNKIRNKALARNVLYITFFTIGFGLYFSSVLYISMKTANLDSQVATINFFYETINSVKMIFFYPQWGVDLLTSQSVLSLLYMLLATVVGSVSIVYFQKVYYKGAIGFAEGGNSGHRRNSKVGGAASNSITKWFFIREFKELTSGSYFFNTIFSNILIVVLYLGMIIYGFFFAGNGEDKQQILDFIREFATMDRILLVTFAVATFFSFFCYGGATSFSRDAYNLDYIGTLPIDKPKAFLGKVMFNALVEFLTVFAFLVPVFIIMQINVLYILASILIMAGVSITLNFIPIIMDLLMPSLNWESETALVKRSKSVMFSMLANVIFIALFLGANYLAITKLNVSLTLLPYVLIGFYAILFIVLFNVYKHLVERAFRRVKL